MDHPIKSKEPRRGAASKAGGRELSSEGRAHDDRESVYQTMDRVVHAGVAKATFGLSPLVLGEAWMDWAVHLSLSPGKRLELMASAMRNAHDLMIAPHGTADKVEAEAGSEERVDQRFSGQGWRTFPFNFFADAHRRNWQWWQEAMTGVHGVSQAHENLLAFTAGAMVDAVAPSNFVLTNPEVIARTIAERGQNLVRGSKNLADDIARKADGSETKEPHAFEVGRNLATTPGKVVFRNDLVELIQYAPTTGTVRPEPILIVPAWIMKYYILDLSPENSLVRYLVDQGFTVFILSWTNPDAGDRDLSMDDYRTLGVMAAVDAVAAITKAKTMHAVGYCLGGTLLSIAAAAMGRDGDDRFASVSFLAAQIDFTEAGELRLFINETQITLIEDMMDEIGYLSSDQMAGTFALLHARDLIWAPAIRDYMLGERGHPFDLMAWNADATRMPARMHSEYLRELFLDNDLAEGHYQVAGKAIAMADVKVPVFAVGTEDDHVAPWRSVYKMHLFLDVDLTFVLTSGGHNTGIVSEPGHKDRHYRMAGTPSDAAFRDPAEWLADTASTDGSWWPAFARWLGNLSAEPGEPPQMGAHSGQYAALCDAPGTYVLQP